MNTKKAKIISIINMKGGVGKTTLSVGICSYLSEFCNKKVLLIDIDPQFNSTQAFVEPEIYEKYSENSKTIFKLFEPSTTLFQNTLPKKEDLIISLKNYKNLDLLCGDLNLVLVNKSADYHLVKRLKKFILDNKLREEYDYIFIDCPPTLTIYTDSALVCSDYYLIPNKIDRYSNIGISSLQKAVTSLIEQEELNLKCLGLIYTIVGENLSKKQKKVKDEIEQNPDIKSIRIFKSNMSNVNDLQVGTQGPIAIKYVKSKKDIEDIVNEIENILIKEV